MPRLAASSFEIGDTDTVIDRNILMTRIYATSQTDDSDNKPMESDMGKGIPEHVKELHIAFGHFMFEFSRVEWLLGQTIKNFANLPDKVARVFLSGVKCDGLSSYLQALLVNLSIPESKTVGIRAVLSQLGTINSTRNMLTHYSVSFAESPKSVVVSNALRVGRIPNIYIGKIRLREIRAMTADLLSIENYFIGYRGPDDADKAPVDAWSYKSREPSHPFRKSPLKNRKPARQPRSSRR